MERRHNGSSWVPDQHRERQPERLPPTIRPVCARCRRPSPARRTSARTLGNQNPGVTNVGGEIGEEFEYGTDPCWAGQTDSGSWTLPAGLTSGSYTASLQASNPGNYEAQGFSPMVRRRLDTGSVQSTTRPLWCSC